MERLILVRAAGRGDVAAGGQRCRFDWGAFDRLLPAGMQQIEVAADWKLIVERWLEAPAPASLPAAEPAAGTAARCGADPAGHSGSAGSLPHRSASITSPPRRHGGARRSQPQRRPSQRARGLAAPAQRLAAAGDSARRVDPDRARRRCRGVRGQRTDRCAAGAVPPVGHRIAAGDPNAAGAVGVAPCA